jgi:hypothetical protein
MAVTVDGGNGGSEGEVRGSAPVPPGPRLVRVAGPPGPRPAEPPPAVRLVREYKGLTVADLLRDEILDRLPGQARAALHHLQRGDLAAAERALPGEFAEVLRGPGAGRRLALSRLLWFLVTAVLLVGTVASFLC